MTRGHHGKHQRVILARATNKPSDADGHRLHRHDPDIALSKRDSCDTHDTPPHKRAAAGGSDVVVERIDSAIVPAALVRRLVPVKLDIDRFVRSVSGIVIWHAIHRAMTVESQCRRQMRRE